MTRIEDALAKLQALGSPPASPRRAAARVPQAARETAPGAAPEHAYVARKLHVDVAKLRRQGFLAPERQEQQLIDQYRAIKRPLLRNASGAQQPAVDKGNLLMVASAFSGEGKTFTCINLCLGIARERDWSVVLVDGDSVKPDLSRSFGVADEPGLIDALRDPSIDIESLIMPTDIPRLALLPAGKKDAQATELLASARMAELCAGMASADRRRMFIFDSAPLLLTNESTILASQVGQVVLVVRANRTSQKAALEARDRLDPSKAICVLLSQSDVTESAATYGEYGG
jgi:protein-tyrosine kinase